MQDEHDPSVSMAASVLDLLPAGIANITEDIINQLPESEDFHAVDNEEDMKMLNDIEEEDVAKGLEQQKDEVSENALGVEPTEVQVIEKLGDEVPDPILEMADGGIVAEVKPWWHDHITIDGTYIHSVETKQVVGRVQQLNPISLKAQCKSHKPNCICWITVKVDKSKLSVLEAEHRLQEWIALGMASSAKEHRDMSDDIKRDCGMNVKFKV